VIHSSTRETPLPVLGEQERLELEAVAESLERTPRLASLMRYLIERYVAGETDQLTEYEIATEVFGRKRASFIASEDSIARVQTHRLRKRLREYYDHEGREHSIKISIPLGTYRPVFTRQSAEAKSANAETGLSEVPLQNGFVAVTATTERPVSTEEPRSKNDRAENGQRETSSYEPSRRHLRVWYFSGVAVLLVLLLTVSAIVRVWHAKSLRSLPDSPTGGIDARASAAVRASSWNEADGSLRLIAGYAGPSEKDSSGNVWQADRYFRNGWAMKQPSVFIAGTGDPAIFHYARAGDCDYNIPLNPGIYELHLYFMQSTPAPRSEDAENQVAFNLAINGQLALTDFDIVSDAMGRNIADERILRDVGPAADGILHLHISTVIGTPSLSAIEILKGIPHKQIPIRIITQPTPYTDRTDRVWHPDTYFIGGRQLSHNMPSTDSPDADWLFSERFGHFMYAIPVDPRDRYTVVLHFVELFFGSEESPGGTGKRVFRVMCNGNTLLDNFDIFKEAGFDKPIQKTYYHLKPNAQGKLNLTFEPITNYATVSAVEVIDEAN
jgi:hypothetical protein